MNKDGELRKAYVERLISDIENFGNTYKYADTVYFGGGTPTLLSTKEIYSILSAVNEKFNISNNAEITAECNPRTVDLDYLKNLRRIGVNRLSMGMQSGVNSELKLLSRAHTHDDLCKVYFDARDAGFENISLDLMYGIPSQTRESFNISLNKAVLLNPDHISSYALKIEEGTPLFKAQDRFSFPDEDEVCDMYDDMCRVLKENGYERYEISNFSKSGKSSKHNLKYWLYDDYIGFGVSAHSFTHGVRVENSRDINAYVSGCDIVSNRDKISYNEAMNEYVMLSMRLHDGVDIKRFNNMFGVDFNVCFGEKFKKYSGEFLYMDGEKCAFTDKGFFVSNHILADVLEF